MSKTLLKNKNDVPLGTIEDLENAVGLLVVEARDAKKSGKDPKKSEGFKDAEQLVKDLANEITKTKVESCIKNWKIQQASKHKELLEAPNVKIKS